MGCFRYYVAATFSKLNSMFVEELNRSF